MRLVCLFVLAMCATCSFANASDKCGEIDFPHFNDTSRTKDERVYKAIREIVLIGKIKEPPFIVCSPTHERNDPVPFVIPLFILRMGKGHALYIPRELSQFTDQELLGILAHELGHTVLFRREGLSKTHTEELLNRREERVDAIAAKWVGAEAVTAGLQAFLRMYIQHYEKKYPDNISMSPYVAGQFAYAKEEVRRRIELLKKIQQ